MGAREGASANAFRNDFPSTAIHGSVAPEDGNSILGNVRVSAFFPR